MILGQTQFGEKQTDGDETMKELCVEKEEEKEKKFILPNK